MESHFLSVHLEEGKTKESYNAPEARQVLQRVTSKYLKRRPDINLYFAQFEEQYGEIESARSIYKSLLNIFPGHIDTTLRYISFERRMKNYDKCEQIFNTAISEAAIVIFTLYFLPQVSNLLFLYIQYGRFLAHVYPENRSKAREIYEEAIDMYPGAIDVWRAYVLFEVDIYNQSSKFQTQTGGNDADNRIIKIFERAIHDESLREGPSRTKDKSNPYSGFFSVRSI